ncbi:MAG: hypothetical protein ACOCUU_02020 [Nanoarchaeota archaeon]
MLRNCNKRGLIAFFILAIFILSSLTFSFNFISSVDLDSAEEKAGDIEQRLDNLDDKIDEIQNPKYGKWDYLGGELEKIIMKNKYISYVFSEETGLLSKIDIVFIVLFGEHYQFSLGLLIVIILWVYFFVQFSGIMRDFSTFSSGTATIIGLAMTVIMAQVKLLSLIVKGLGWLVASPDAWWMRTLVVIGLVLFFMLVSAINNTLRMIEKKRKEEEERLKTKSEMNFIQKFGSAIREALNK